MSPAPALVVQTAFLGDVVLTTGLLNELADRGGLLDVVTTPAAAPLLEPHRAVRRVIRYDKQGRDRGVAGFLRTVRALRGERYRCAWLPHRSLRSALLARMAGIPERIGFAGSPGALWYTHRIPRPESGHEAERILALAEPAPGTRARVSLDLTVEDRAAARNWLSSHLIAEPFIAMAPGSIWGTKRWRHYPELARLLPGPIVVLGSAADRELGLAIAAAAPERTGVAAGQLPLRAGAALIEMASVVVTNDSAPLHLASAVGTRVVALFGPTVPAFGFGPRGMQDVIVEVPGLSCRPCSSHGPQVCPLGHHRCMGEITVERVAAAVRALTG